MSCTDGGVGGAECSGVCLVVTKRMRKHAALPSPTPTLHSHPPPPAPPPPPPRPPPPGRWSIRVNWPFRSARFSSVALLSSLWVGGWGWGGVWVGWGGVGWGGVGWGGVGWGGVGWGGVGWGGVGWGGVGWGGVGWGGVGWGGVGWGGVGWGGWWWWWVGVGWVVVVVGGGGGGGGEGGGGGGGGGGRMWEQRTGIERSGREPVMRAHLWYAPTSVLEPALIWLMPSLSSSRRISADSRVLHVGVVRKHTGGMRG